MNKVYVLTTTTGLVIGVFTSERRAKAARAVEEREHQACAYLITETRLNEVLHATQDEG